MEFLDEDTRPRFVFQQLPPSSSLPQAENPNFPSKILLSISIPVSLSLLFSSLFYLQTEPIKSLLLWLSLSFLVGPFAPPSLTGGHIRVGDGPVIVEPEEENRDQLPVESRKKRSKPQRNDGGMEVKAPERGMGNGWSRKEDKGRDDGVRNDGSVVNLEKENDWNEEDVEILKKQLVKHPAGKPGRWETVAAGLGGRYRVDSVIKKAKELAEKKGNGDDDYTQFLKNRKPVDTRMAESKAENLVMDDGESKKETTWSNGEDIALLNALKVFPKDVGMRWEKIAAAVPGKTKAACMKRVSELKRDFRSSKAGAES